LSKDERGIGVTDGAGCDVVALNACCHILPGIGEG
jgi:hypothetical protein